MAFETRRLVARTIRQGGLAWKIPRVGIGQIVPRVGDPLFNRVDGGASIVFHANGAGRGQKNFISVGVHVERGIRRLSVR